MKRYTSGSSGSSGGEVQSIAINYSQSINELVNQKLVTVTHSENLKLKTENLLINLINP